MANLEPVGAVRRRMVPLGATQSYPSNWRTVEDEELAALDLRLLAQAAGPTRGLALDRLAAMAGDRLARRRLAADRVAARLRTAGFEPREQDEDRRRPAPTPLRQAARGVARLFGAERRLRDLHADWLLHRLAIAALERLEARMADRSAQDRPPSGEEGRTEAHLCSLFSGFNAAYLWPALSFDAESLAAAAWLGWRLEYRHAPLPAPAVFVIRGLRNQAAAPSGPDQVLLFGLRAAAVSAARPERHAHGQWPTPLAALDRAPGQPDAKAGRAFIVLLRRPEVS